MLGILCGVVGEIGGIIFIMSAGGFYNIRSYLLSLAAFFVFMLFKNLNPIYLLVVLGLVGMIIF